MEHGIVFSHPGFFYFLLCFFLFMIMLDILTLMFFNNVQWISMHCTCLNQVLVQIQLSDT